MNVLDKDQLIFKNDLHPETEDCILRIQDGMVVTRNYTEHVMITFDAFDVDRKGYIETDMIGTIMDMLGTRLIGEELEKVIDEIDEDGNGEVSFEEFAKLAARFIVEEDEDTEAIQLELKGAFRLYDRDGNGFITTDVLREILRELDDKLSEDDLDNMIDEIDTDGSGTVDWDEFKAVMIG